MKYEVIRHIPSCVDTDERDNPKNSVIIDTYDFNLPTLREKCHWLLEECAYAICETRTLDYKQRLVRVDEYCIRIYKDAEVTFVVANIYPLKDNNEV